MTKSSTKLSSGATRQHTRRPRVERSPKQRRLATASTASLPPAAAAVAAVKAEGGEPAGPSGSDFLAAVAAEAEAARRHARAEQGNTYKVPARCAFWKKMLVYFGKQAARS